MKLIIILIVIACTIASTLSKSRMSPKPQISPRLLSQLAFRARSPRVHKAERLHGPGERPADISTDAEPKCCTPEVYEVNFDMNGYIENERGQILAENWCEFSVDGYNKLSAMNVTTIYTGQPLPISMSYVYDGNKKKLYSIYPELDCSVESEIWFQNSGDWEASCIPGYAQVLDEVTVGNGLLEPGVEALAYSWFTWDGYSEVSDNGAGVVKIVATKRDCTPIWDEFTGLVMDDENDIGYSEFTSLYSNFHNGVRDPESKFRVPGPCPVEKAKSLKKLSWPSSKGTLEMKLKQQIFNNLLKELI